MIAIGNMMYMPNYFLISTLHRGSRDGEGIVRWDERLWFGAYLEHFEVGTTHLKCA
jgi:hypothetical protein